tara:strand:- start:268 stop:1050 length:783 start_codon:yes stop_codon:yes gene_type:complete
MEKKAFKIVSTKKRRHLLPNALTLIGVCLGISSIKFALDGNYSLSVIFLLFAALLDGLDGRIARLIDGTSEFGKELDSLTDFVSFGIAPAFILFFWELKNYGKIGWAITLIFSVCCVLRLARFNLTKIQKEEEWKVNYFEGIPSPAGGILVLMPLIFDLSSFNIGYEVKNLTPYLAIVVSILLISKIPTFSFKKIAIQRKLTIFLFLGIGIICISLIFYTFETLVILGLIYFFLIPLGVLSYKKNIASKNFTEDENEDIL